MTRALLRRLRRGGPARAGHLMLLGWALLLASWVGGQPPGAAPDEAAHLVKALGTATGQGLGAPPDVPAPPRNAFLSRYVRQYDLPEGWRIDVRPPCYISLPDSPGTDAGCLGGAEPRPSFQDWDQDLLGREGPGTGLTYVAPYPPLPYVLPGALARLAPDPGSAGYGARVGSALGVLLLLGLATQAATTRMRLTGLAVAVTPMAMFLGGSTNPSGPAVAAAVTAAAGGGLLARASRDAVACTGAPLVRVAWLALGLGGAALCLVRPEGPLLAGPLVAVVLLLLGARGFARVWRLAPTTAAASTAILTAASGLGIGWGLAVMPRLPAVERGEADATDGTSASSGNAVVDDLTRFAQETVAATGWRDVPYPGWLIGAWLLAGAALVLVALVRVRDLRARLALVLFAASGPLLYVLVALALLQPVGGSVQARYVLPVLAGAVVLAAVAAPDRPGRDRADTLLALLVGAVVLVGHLTARVLDARRYAVGPDAPPGVGWVFDAPWQPPGGAWLWLLAAVAGAALVAVAPLLHREDDVRP